MPIIAIILTLITAQCISANVGWNFLVSIIPAFICVVFVFFLLNAIFNIVLMCFFETSDILKKIDKKVVIAIIVVILIIIGYNTFFRYKYRTYKGNYNQIQVIKVDTLTGKSTVSFPKFEEK